MATTVSTLVAGLKDLGRDGFADHLSDNELAGLIGGAVDWCGIHLPNHCDFTITGQSGDRVVTTSVITPSVAGRFRSLVLAVALWRASVSGMTKRAERNVGSVSLASHSADTSSTVSQHRLNAAALKADVDAAVAAITGKTEHAQTDVDFSKLGS